MTKEYLIYNDKLLFDLQDKCGSTSFLKYFYKDLKEGTDKKEGTLHNYRKNNLINYFDSTKITIKLVRNPYSRIISIFLHFVIGRKTNISFLKFLKLLEKFASNNFKNIDNEKIFDNYRFNKMCFLLSNNNTYDHIIKLENLHNDIENLNIKYNLNLNLEKNIKLNIRKKHKHTIINFDYINSNINLYINKLPSDYSVFYNNETKNIVYNIYKDDIILYNYEYPY